MKRRLVQAFLSGMVFTISTSAFAQTKSSETAPTKHSVTISTDKTLDQKTEKLRILLSGYEYFPTRADLENVATSVQSIYILKHFVDDIALRPTLRVRAIDALAYFPTAEVKTFLTAKIEDKKVLKGRIAKRIQKRFREHAITSLAKGFKKSALPYLEELATSSNLDVKLSAVYGIGKHCGKEGLTVLKALRPSEKNAVVLRVYRKFLGH